MFDPTDASNARARVARVKVADADFAARVAIGTRNKPRNGRTTWIVMTIHGGTAVLDEFRDLASDELPEDVLKVVLALSATPTTWGSLAGNDEFMAAIGEQKFFVTGETPFFIRHLSSFLQLLQPFRR